MIQKITFLVERRKCINQILFDKYRIVKVLGSGGSATVYLAQHIKLESFRAIKCIRKDNPLYNNALKEAYILKNLRHSNIPIIYDIDEDLRCSYIIEEYIEGEYIIESQQTL